VIGDRINTDENWYVRKHYCLKNFYTKKRQLLDDSKDPKNISLATFKPAKVLGFPLYQLSLLQMKRDGIFRN